MLIEPDVFKSDTNIYRSNYVTMDVIITDQLKTVLF